MGGLTLDRVKVCYGETVALDAISLSVEAGEVVAVVGPSGSGKSSLLRAVAGLQPIASGSIRLGGVDLATVPTHERKLGLMFQNNALFPHLSVSANIAYGLKRAGISRNDQGQRVNELLALIGLVGYGDRHVDSLSGGEAQRVALARALAPTPGLLMLDEPLGSLDRGLRERLTRELARVLAALGQTALHVTHDQAEAFTLADRVAVIMEGRLARVGTPRELWDDPGTATVARFVGHENVLPIETASGRVTWFGIDLGPVSRPLGNGRRPVALVVPEKAVTIGVPEGGDDGQMARLDGVVQAVGFDRGRSRVTVAFGDRAALVAETEVSLAVGDRVTATIDLAATIRVAAT